MDWQTEGSELIEAVESAWEEYTQLTQEYGSFLRCAFGAPRGSSRMLAALQCANELGPHLSMVLRRYLDAMEILAAFYGDALAGSEGSHSRNGLPTALRAN